MNALIFGLGRSGSSVLRHLKKLGWTGVWYDDSAQPFGADLATKLGFARLEQFDLSGIEVVIAAPGVMLRHPQLQAALAAGVPIWGEAELAWRTANFSSIGITGTAGKGSTTLLIAHLLRSQGLDAQVGGNFDPPLLEVLSAQVCVVELSSFQLERIHTYRPEVAVITNIGVDHVRDHGTLEAYQAAKWRITQNQNAQDTLILPESLPQATTTKAKVQRVLEAGDIYAGESLLLSEKDLPHTIHPQNARAGVAAVAAYLAQKQLEPNLDKMRQALLGFVGIPGRFETIATLQNTRFIEDSIATRVLAVKAALEHAPAPIAWLVGGRDKLTPEEHASELPKLEPFLGKVALLIAFGESGLEYAKALQHTGIRIADLSQENAQTLMPKAVRLGFEAAKSGSVLLAPLGTSFDLFDNYKARGQAFREAVESLVQEQKETYA
ncbi:MAG: UDP-N-acetylmuramoyl-L-alanine--D-glutamate ligase [Deinococcales bacterium]